MASTMKAFVVDKNEDVFERKIVSVPLPKPHEGETLVRVVWSSINYKDCLASIPNGKVIRNYPRIPGIDFAGIVEKSTSSKFLVGTPVFSNGNTLGVTSDGGFAEYCVVPNEYLMPLPDSLDLSKTMIAGTAGFTAAQSVLELLENGVVPDRGPILVTGATGGVGSFAVALLASLGFEVVASTGRRNRADWLRQIGAQEVIDRLPNQTKSLESEQWSAVLDTVGGTSLAAALASVKYSGVVTACGNTGGVELQTTVFPFILRGIKLVGIDSVNCPMDAKIKVWTWLGQTLNAKYWDFLVGKTVHLNDLPDALDEVLSGSAHGRTIVSIG